MVEYTYLSDSYLFISNLLFLLSYCQKQLLLLRLTLVSATAFWMMMGLRYPVAFYDVIIFNVIFIIINLYLSFKMIIKLVPPKFSPEERKLYNQYFSKCFKPNEFKKLMECSRRKVYKVNTNVITQNTSFYALILIVDLIGKNVKIDLKVNGIVVSKLHQHSWVGIVEYIEIINKQNLSAAIENEECGKWECSVDVQLQEIEEEEEEDSDFNDSSFEEKVVIKTDNINNSQIIIYEWDLYVNETLNFLEPRHPL